jgi:Ca2+/Na+ antiporter
MDFLDNVVNFLYGLEIGDRLEFAYRVIDFLYYYTFFRIIILVPILIFIGFIISKFFLREKGSLKDDLIISYTVFIFFFAVGISGDIIFILMGGLFVLINLYRFFNYYHQTNATAQEKILEKLDEIKEKLK